MTASRNLDITVWAIDEASNVIRGKAVTVLRFLPDGQVTSSQRRHVMR